MKTSIDHLPENKQEELARVVEIPHAEFEDALTESNANGKKSGRIVKIILFGPQRLGRRAAYDEGISHRFRSAGDRQRKQARRLRLLVQGKG
jgi:hypothetical protein